MSRDMLVLVPSRGRPESILRMAQAWSDTGAFEVADLTVLIDQDDPHYRRYFALLQADLHGGCVRYYVESEWLPMVKKLNRAAVFAARSQDAYPVLAFMGDDHVPRTSGWAVRMVEELHKLGTGIVYGDDLLQGHRLPTHWAMTSDIVSGLGRMVPAPVDHLYCDNAILALGRTAECIRYLPDVKIEHMHPVAGKAEWDDQYRKVNDNQQYRVDGAAYAEWKTRDRLVDAEIVRQLRSAHGQHRIQHR